MCIDFWCVAVLSCGEQNRLRAFSLHARIRKRVYDFGFEYFSVYGTSEEERERKATKFNVDKHRNALRKPPSS